MPRALFAHAQLAHTPQRDAVGLGLVVLTRTSQKQNKNKYISFWQTRKKKDCNTYVLENTQLHPLHPQVRQPWTPMTSLPAGLAWVPSSHGRQVEGAVIGGNERGGM